MSTFLIAFIVAVVIICAVLAFAINKRAKSAPGTKSGGGTGEETGGEGP
jgi:hypothetical protein